MPFLAFRLFTSPYVRTYICVYIIFARVQFIFCEGRWRADSIASDEQSRDEASTAAALEEEQDASAQTFTVQAFRRARSHSLLFEIMSQT